LPEALAASRIRRAGGQINAERLLREEVLSSREDVEIEGLVQVVGNGHVHHINIGRCQQFLVILGQEFDRRNLAEPLEKLVLEIAAPRPARP
jgi:hypothetical protein